MTKRLERIANDLEITVYKDKIHGIIARDNFIYGIAQAKIETIDWLTMHNVDKAIINDFIKFMN